MNTYIETCVAILNRILKGMLRFEEHLNRVTDSACKRLNEAGEIVICGLSPIGRNCLAHVGDYTSATPTVFDVRSNAAKTALDYTAPCGEKKQVLNIICSREEALVYLDAVSGHMGDVLSYNELLLLDECFGVKNSLLHNRQYVAGAMQSVFDRAEEYLELLDALEDISSKELLSRWVLYRLYQDISLFRGLQKSSRPYFDPPLVVLTETDVFVDAGGYDGDTLSDFLRMTNGAFLEYHFFEPEAKVLAKAKSAFGQDPRIHFYQKGLSNQSTVEYYDDACTDMPELMRSDTGTLSVETCALDDLRLSPTFIKMDIEGAELGALDGARETIHRCKPALAICVYHRPNDPLEIYAKLNQLGYQRLFLRAEKGTLDFDVVMYGI